MGHGLGILNQQFFHKYLNEDQSQPKPNPQIAELRNQLIKSNQTAEMYNDKQKKAKINFEHSEREGELIKSRLQVPKLLFLVEICDCHIVFF